MEFRSPNSHTITTRLTREDLDRMHLTFEAMDYSDAHTRRAIQALLDDACRELHISANTRGRMIIEAFAEHDGGCRIVYTLPPEKGRLRLMIKRRRGAYAFAFSNMDNLLDACAALPVRPESDLYQTEEGYCLILYPGERDRSVRTLLNEYGTPCGDSPAALQIIREHGRLLCCGNATHRLSGV